MCNFSPFWMLFVIRERPLAAPPPQRQMLLAVLTAELCCSFDEQAEDRRTIVVGQLNKPGLGNQAAKLDQLPRPLPSFHLPLARVSARACRHQAEAPGRGPAMLQRRLMQRRLERGVRAERSSHLPCASPP